MKYALDTNTVIYFFKGSGRVKHNFLAKKPQQIFIPSVVAYELEYGIAKSSQAEEKRLQLENFLEVCRVCEFGRKEGQVAAQIRAELEAKGQPIGPLDTLIAGTALANGLILVSHNGREFNKVRGLQIEDWY